MSLGSGAASGGAVGDPQSSMASGEAAPAGQPTASAQAADMVAQAVPIFQPRRLRADGFLYGALLLAAIALLVVAGLWRGKGVLAK